MDAGLKWLFENSDRIGSFVLLLSFVLSLQRRWVVMGWVYHDCATELREFRAEVKAIAEGNEEKIARLEKKIEAMRDHRGVKSP